jgi:hypothetical protein
MSGIVYVVPFVGKVLAAKSQESEVIGADTREAEVYPSPCRDRFIGQR